MNENRKIAARIQAALSRLISERYAHVSLSAAACRNTSALDHGMAPEAMRSDVARPTDGGAN